MVVYHLSRDRGLNGHYQDEGAIDELGPSYRLQVQT